MLRTVCVQPSKCASAYVEVNGMATLMIGIARTRCTVSVIACSAHVAVVEILLLRHRAKSTVDPEQDPVGLRRLRHRQEGIGGGDLHGMSVHSDDRDREWSATSISRVGARGAVICNEGRRRSSGGRLFEVFGGARVRRARREQEEQRPGGTAQTSTCVLRTSAVRRGEGTVMPRSPCFFSVLEFCHVALVRTVADDRRSLAPVHRTLAPRSPSKSGPQ